MLNEDFFPDLNPNRLEACAHVWAKRYPFIDKIVLYKGVSHHKPYVLLLEIPKDFDPTDPSYHDFVNLWVLGLSHTMNDAQDLLKVSKIQYDSADEYLSKWLICKKGVKDEDKWPEIETYEDRLDGFIVPEFAWVLFDKDNPSQEKKQKPHGKDTEAIKQKVFPCEPGTDWSDVFITLVADDTVRIETPQGEGRFSYHELGMSDKRTGDKPTLLWGLLKLFAQNHGFISRENPNYDPKLPSTTKRLNKRLKNLFGIKESIYVGYYKTLKGYKTKIQFHNQTFS